MDSGVEEKGLSFSNILMVALVVCLDVKVLFSCVFVISRFYLG